MKFILFDIHETLKNSRIGSATITRNPLNLFRSSCHTNFIVMKSDDFDVEGTFVGRIIGDHLTLATGKTGKVTPLEGNLSLFEPDSYFKTLRTGWIRQIDVNKIKEENPRSGSFFILSPQTGPKEWAKASFDEDGTLDFGKDPIRGIALIDSLEKLS